MTAVPEYLSLTDIADRLGVKRDMLYQSRWRYRDKDPRFPAPDVTLANREGWRAERVDEIRDWLKARPGRGAGGGRPKGRRTGTEREQPSAN
jgi:hypothetical protein